MTHIRRSLITVTVSVLIALAMLICPAACPAAAGAGAEALFDEAEETAAEDSAGIPPREEQPEAAADREAFAGTLKLYIGVIGTVLFAAGASAIIFGRRGRLEYLTAGLVFGLGLIYLVVITPFSVPDETYHYNSAYHLSNYLLLRSENDFGNGDSADFPYDSFDSHCNTFRGYANGIGRFFDEKKPGETVPVPELESLEYFTEYAAPALGLAIGRAAGMNFIQMFFLGRLMNLFLFTVCVFFAVKAMPCFKILPGLIALLPVTIQEAASFSYDAFTNGLSILLIALIFKAILEKGALSGKDKLRILITGALLAPAKIIYGVILLLVLLIPRERFGSRKAKLTYCGVLFAVCFGLIILFSIPTIKRFFSPQTGTVSGGTEHYTLSYVFEHPLQTLKIFACTVKLRLKRYIVMLFGGLSGLSLYLPKPLIVFWILLFPAALAAEKRTRVSAALRLACTAVFIIVSALIMLSMLLSWTPYGNIVVRGVQGRYFIPVLPLLLTAVYIPLRRPGVEISSEKAQEKTKKRRISLFSDNRWLFIPELALQYISVVYVLNITILH